MYRLMGPAFVMLVIMMSAGLAAAQPASAHPMIGDWRVNTDGVGAGEPVRAGNYAFGQDGSILVVFQARPTGQMTAELMWWGEGTWEADGEHAVRYTLSWPTKNAEGATTGTVTFDGVLAIRDDGLTFAEDRSRSLVTVRNQLGILMATYGGDPTELTAAFTGERIQVGSR
jgi:hypothetical protein